jgi:hypothetical protein
MDDDETVAGVTKATFRCRTKVGSEPDECRVGKQAIGSVLETR